MNKQTGFLLSYLKYGENDAIAHCYTQENGYQSFFIRGIYAAKNKKKAYLLPLNELSLTLSSHGLNASLPTVAKIEKKGTSDEQWDIRQSAVIFFIADFLNQTLRNEGSNATLYREIALFKEQLSAGNLQAHFYFLIKTLAIYGIAPLVSDEKFLNLEKGIFEEWLSGQSADEETSLVWKKILSEENAAAFRPESKLRKKLLDSILTFYKCHFPEFHTPKSLQVILQLFE